MNSESTTDTPQEIDMWNPSHRQTDSGQGVKTETGDDNVTSDMFHQLQSADNREEKVDIKQESDFFVDLSSAPLNLRNSATSEHCEEKSSSDTLEMEEERLAFIKSEPVWADISTDEEDGATSADDDQECDGPLSGICQVPASGQTSSAGDEGSKTLTPVTNLEVIHGGQNVFVCDVCSKILSSAQNLVAHRRVHTGQTFDCDVCNKGFTKASNLKAHKIIHSRQKFPCDVCSKSFSQKSYLRIHKMTHTGPAFSCDVCSKSFSTAGSLKTHKISHTGLRFPCDVCDKTFSQPSHLRTHKMIHTGQRFSCDVCSKSFNQESTLKTHKLIHIGQTFSCDVCSKNYSTPSSLKRHKKIHTRTSHQTFSCNVCCKKFTLSSSLKRHMQRHTGQTVS